jgi:hypothetical protein
MPDQRDEPYPLEPNDTSENQPVERKPGIDAPGLLSEFPEDADFDRDPEMDRVVAGPTSHPSSPGAPAQTPPEDFVRPGFGDARVWGITGAVLLVGAMIATGVNVETRVLANIFLTMYNTLLHTGTGVVALFAAAILTEHRLGAFELAAARMFTAVAAFALVFSLNINIVGEGWEQWKGEEVIMAALAYVLLVAALFGLWGWRSLLYVVGSHFFLWLIMYVGMLLSAHVRAPL